MHENEKNGNAGRREFLKATGKAALGTTLAFNIGLPAEARKLNAETLKVGLIGCGGRGTGAAFQAINSEDNVILTAMGDVFEDRLASSLKNLKKEAGDKKIKVNEGHQFIGFDAYKKVLETDVDMVILATPPTFRPGHLEAAINAGKHVFCEKPMAVDAPGLRKVMDAAKKAKEKDLALVSGFCWRYDYPKRATFQRVLEGEIGEVMNVYNTYNTGALWSKKRQPDWTDMEYKMRNWLYYNWLSGDHIAEQAIHSLDMMAWAMGDQKPVSVSGTGGRQQRTEPEFGHIFDHFALVYEYENGAKGFHFSRQQKFCDNSYAVDMNGTKGTCLVDCIKRIHRISNGSTWEYEGKNPNMYQVEHNELFASIRKGEPINDGEWMAKSTMLALMGRMAAYTGQTITWEEAINSEEKLGPDLNDYSWDMEWPTKPVPVPGITKFN